MSDESENSSPAIPENESWGDTLIDLTPGEPLKPRYRKLVELAAQGKRPGEIAKELEYTPGRVSVILSNSIIKAEISKVQDKIYEDTIGKRLKDLAEPALALVDKCLHDTTNRYKEQLKIDTAKWLIEKIDGKAIQKHSLEGGALLNVLDRLDAMKSSGRDLFDGETQIVQSEQKQLGSGPEIIDIEEISPEKTEEQRLARWVEDL